MDIDSQIAAKIDEMKQIKTALDNLELLHKVKPGKVIIFNSPTEIYQAGELHIMKEIASIEFELLLMQNDSNRNYNPQTLLNIINLKKKELQEHRELQQREGYSLTDFKYKN